jgi:lysozyme
MAKRKGNRTGLRLLAAALLAAMLAGGWAWWYLIHWQPDRGAFPIQGVEVGDPEGKVDFGAIKAIGADVAFLDASASAFARDTSFVANLDAARAAKLQVGAVHRYDPCQPADKQAANFVTVVPRDQSLLPPAVDLSQLAENCPVKVPDAAVESELTTFINQVETHTGVPVILKIAPAFEKRYRVAATINRNIWVERDRFQPDYAGRPWTLWTANTDLNNEATPGALRWVVMQP